MGLLQILPALPWQLLSKKAKEKLSHLKHVGFFSVKEAESRQMRLVTGKEGMLIFYWLVDESDGVIADAKFQVFGPPALVVLAEIASELAIRKTYDQVSFFSFELLDHYLRDKKEEAPLPFDSAPFYNQVLSAIDHAVYQCRDIPYAQSDDKVTPISWDVSDLPDGLPGWSEFSLEKQRKIIEEVIEKEIRPYVELDAGGVQVVDYQANGEVSIAYEGSCTTCHSSTGSTLSAIQQILRGRVHPSLTVIPIL
jgi:NifU-like protein